MSERAIIAFRWGRIVKVGSVAEGAPDPTPDELAAIAAELPPDPTGEPPRVRVIAQAGWPPVTRSREWRDPLDDWPGSP